MEKTVQKIPFLRLTISLSLGIILGNLVYIKNTSIVIFVVLNLLTLILLNQKYKYQFTTFFGFFVFTLFALIGLLAFNLHNKRPAYYTHSTFQATVLETPQEKPASYKSVLHAFTLLRNDSVFKTDEKVLVYFQKGENVKALQPGDNITFSGSPEVVQNRGNPYEFDYKKYLAQRKIFRQIYLPATDWKKTNTNTAFSLIVVAEQFREKLLDIYRSQHIGKPQFEILSALTLGYKRNMDPEIKTAFASSGAMHILAVSGLHVGIIYGVLLFLLGFLKRRKIGKITFVIIILFCLWSYAFISGLSPSVERAATMFSLLVIGDSLKRRINIYNSLAASALLILLINPNNLFEVGFQLSYAAVFGIVYLQPRLAKLVAIKSKVLRFFWILFTVSVAAQTTTFPFTLYYFNQFPSYFWLANLIVIPAVSVLIPLGLALLIFAKIPLLSTIISVIVNYLIYGIYFVLRQIEQLPFSVLYESVHPVELVFIFGLLFSFLILIKKPRIYTFNIGMFCIFLLIVSGTFIKVSRFNKNEIIVYNYPENTILHLIHGKENFVLSKKEINENDYAINLLKQTNQKLHLKNPIYLTLKDTLINQHLFSEGGVVFFGDRTILFEQSIHTIPDNYSIDFAINPIFSDNKEWGKAKQTSIILTKKYYQKKINSSGHLHLVNSDGAFRRKW